MRKIFFIFFFLICLSTSIYAITFSKDAIEINETFVNDTSYTALGWDYTQTGGCPTNPTLWLSEYAYHTDAGQCTVQSMTKTVGSYYNNSNIDKVIEFRHSAISRFILRLGTVLEFDFNNHYSGEILVSTSTSPGAECTYNLSSLTTYGGVMNNSYHDFTLHIEDSLADLYVDNYTVCTNMEYTTTDTSLMYLYNLGFGALSYLMVYNTTGQTSSTPCSYPKLFCDDFNYNGSLYQKTSEAQGWYVYNADASLNTGFAPTNYQAVLNSSMPVILRAYSKSFPVDYQYIPIGTGEPIYVTQNFYAPVMSVEMDWMINTSTADEEIAFLRAYDVDGDACFTMHLDGNPAGAALNVSYVSTSTGKDVVLGSLTPGVGYDFKISTYFSAVNKTELYLFNTSYKETYSKIYINDSVLSGQYNLPNDCDGIWKVEVEKEYATARMDIDNFYIYVGTDPDTDTTDQDYIETVIKDTEQVYNDTLIGPTGSQDLNQVVGSFWDDVGLISAGSKTFFGLALMVLLAIFISMAFVSMKTTPNVGIIALIEIIFMFFLTFIGLLPVWILITLGVLSAGIGVIGFRMFALN